MKFLLCGAYTNPNMWFVTRLYLNILYHKPTLHAYAVVSAVSVKKIISERNLFLCLDDTFQLNANDHIKLNMLLLTVYTMRFECKRSPINLYICVTEFNKVNNLYRKSKCQIFVLVINVFFNRGNKTIKGHGLVRVAVKFLLSDSANLRQENLKT